MSNIKTEINAYIKQNGRQQITGSVLNGVLNHMVDYTDESIPNVPTKTSELTNDSGFLTSHQDISGKVDKVAGKGLSTNDFTNADKSKLDGIANGAEANVQSDWNETDATKDSFIKNKPSIPSVPTDDINANTQARHTHSNKAILDAITSAPITEHQDISGKANISYVDEKVGEIASKVGTLSDLQTTAKNNLVSAVNEVVNMIVTSLNTPV